MSEWLSECVAISLLLSLVTAAAAFMVYSGLIAHITVLTGSPPIKKITFAYKFRQGPYRNCGQLFKEAHSVGPKLPCIGVYYDDPNEVPGPLCRYAVGSILSEGETDADEELLKRYEASGFQVFSFPEVTHVVTCWFPNRTYFSVLLGVRRVYPRLARYIKERHLCAHPFLEIYREGRIHFMGPLARQGDFYVPEVRRAERSLSEEDELLSDSEVSGVDSNSEYSSGSGVLLSDSRETSPEDSWFHSPLEQDEGDSGCRERSSGEVSFKELDWEQTGERQHQQQHQQQQQQAGTEVELSPESNQKSSDAPTQECWGALGEE